MTLTTWLLCWYAVGILTILYMWLSDRSNLTIGGLLGCSILALFGPIIPIVGFVGSRVPASWLDIVLIRR